MYIIDYFYSMQTSWAACTFRQHNWLRWTPTVANTTKNQMIFAKCQPADFVCGKRTLASYLIFSCYSNRSIQPTSAKGYTLQVTVYFYRTIINTTQRRQSYTWIFLGPVLLNQRLLNRPLTDDVIAFTLRKSQNLHYRHGIDQSK